MHYLKRMEQVLENAEIEFKRLLAVRIDLRLPENYPLEIVSYTETLPGRFLKSLDKKIKSHLIKREREGERIHTESLRFIWVKEQAENHSVPHWHFVEKGTFYLDQYKRPQWIRSRLRLLEQLEYLVKHYSKRYGESGRSFGTSIR